VVLLRHLDAWPRALRWVVFLPAGILVMLIVQGVLDAVYNAAGLPRSPSSTGGVARAALVGFTWALGVTLFPAVLSPRPWAVGVVMSVVAFLAGVAPLVSILMTPYQRGRLPSFAVALAASIGAHVLGAGAGLYLIRQLTARPSGAQIDSRAQRDLTP
jgi:hypothetical protein